MWYKAYGQLPVKIHLKASSKHLKIDPKTFPNPSQNAPKSMSGGGLSGSWGDGAFSFAFFLFLETSCGLHGGSWHILGASWGVLGAIRARVWGVLGRLGASWGRLGAS